MREALELVYQFVLRLTADFSLVVKYDAVVSGLTYGDLRSLELALHPELVARRHV